MTEDDQKKAENSPSKEETAKPEEDKGVQVPETKAESPEEKKNAPETKEEISLEEFRLKPEILKSGGRVCITYGRDQIMNRQVVSLIKELGISPLIMQDKNNKSKPIAQFFTENPDIAFSIAILSADDWLYPKNGKPKDALLHADPTVIFHLGFWIGHLGRRRVFALYYDQRSFRWPTEHFDVIYTPLDKDGLWKKELVSRLRASSILFTGGSK